MARKTQESGDRSQEPGETASPAMTLDDLPLANNVSGETLPSAESLVASPAPSGRPFCGTHNCLMKAVRSSKTDTHFACPVPLCDAKEKRARASVHIPREPHRCPDVRCQGKTIESYLEVDLRRSTTAHLCMVCPKCGYDIKVPRPQFNSGVRTYERDEGDLAAR